jgi:dUTP pyrophosphatase
MNTVRIRIKRLDRCSDVPLPAYETEGASGMDLRAAVEGKVVLNPGEVGFIPTGLLVSIPRGYEAQIRPRSGLALKYGIGMVNSPGTIDSDYRGEVGLIMINWGKEPFVIQRGDRIAQMVISKVFRAEFLEANDLESTRRGEKGFGHSGVK